MRRFLAMMAVLALTILRGSAQDAARAPSGPQATFKTGVDLIQLDVSVLDRNRIPVRGLTAADFTILEDGMSQPIAAFTAVDLPDVVTAGAAWQRNVAPDVVSNRFDAQRVVVILLDDWNVPFDPGVSKIAKTIAQGVIDRLGPADLGAVVYTRARNNGQELTTDRSRLTAAVDRFQPAGGAEDPGRFSASRPNRPSVAMANAQMNFCSFSHCTTQALQKVAEVLQAKPGARKTLVLISPAMLLSMTELENPTLRSELQAAISAMQLANVNVYEFDPRGLQVSRNPNEDFDIFSDATGGRAVHDTNTPWEAVPQVFRENSSYYLLGFRSTKREDGQFHKVAVKVARPGVEVRSRSGYFARAPERAKPSKKPEPTELERAIARGLPTGDFPVSVTAAPFAESGGRDAALIVVAGVDRTSDSPSSEVVEMNAVAFDANWKPAREFTQTLELNRKDKNSDVHFDIGSRLDLRPGRYELRLAARVQGSDRTGSVHTSVTIPDFAKAPLSFSGIVLQRAPAQAATASIKTILPIVPTTVREFATTDRVTGFFRVHQGGRNAMKLVRLTIRIVDDTDRAVVDESATADAAKFGSGRTLDRWFVLPLNRLQPGAYMVSISATAGDQPAVERALTFRVR